MAETGAVSGSPNLLAVPDRSAMLRLPAGQRHFMVFVDTEEEFDWLGGVDREATRVTATAGMARCHQMLARAGVRPVYLTDYPVLESDAANALMRQWIADDTADVGAHLHPWVNPPHDEVVSGTNSFAGNLPEALERAKLGALCARMEERLGIRPTAYRAGRYGVGPDTARILMDLGFRLDCSVRSRFDYSTAGGPDFTDMPVQPYRLASGAGGGLFELPLSTAYVGPLRRIGGPLHRWAGAVPKVPGALARTGLFARTPLTPEGVSARECIAAIDTLLDCETSLLSFSFHSPTTEAGHTPYVRDAAALEDFYRWWDIVLDHLGKRSVAPLALAGLYALLESANAPEPTCQAA